MRFIDREKELAGLEKFWREKEAQLVVIYGKRRIGKTELIKQFINEKPHIYFLAQKINEHENLKLLAEVIGEFFSDNFLMQSGFNDWKMVFEYLKSHIKQRIVFVIDEFPYLTEANKGISSIFQMGWDEYLKDTHIFLILCGSSISMMEEEVLSQKAPLYGRRTGQIFLKPFSFSNARKFYPKASFEKSLELYAIAGGNPTYLKKLNSDISWEDNVKKNVLSPEAFLYNEVEFILREELREPRNYWSILKAIATGNTRIGEIVNETGLAKGKLHKYLFILEDLQIIQKEVPATEKNPLKSRKGIYKLQDEFFKFWFRYVLPHRGHIEEGKIKFALNKIKNDFNIFLSETYEKIAKELLYEYEDKIFPFTKIGRWWDRNEEIDIVALDDTNKKVLFGEVKWSNKPVGIDIYEDLKKKAKKVDWHNDERKEYFCLFSKSGFTTQMNNIAKKEKVFLFFKDKLINL